MNVLFGKILFWILVFIIAFITCGARNRLGIHMKMSVTRKRIFVAWGGLIIALSASLLYTAIFHHR